MLLSISILCGIAPEARSDAVEVVTQDAVVRQRLDGNDKAPALVYYAIDTEEPFMQIAIDFEVRQLQSVCLPGTNVNWVVILNSAVRGDRPLLVCKDGRYEKREVTSLMPVGEIDYLVDSMAELRADYADHPVEGGVTVDGLPTDEDTRVFFETYPLADPRSLWDLLRFVHQTIFPLDAYSLFVTVKAHGSGQNNLSGFTAGELATRAQEQRALWRKLHESGVLAGSLPEIQPGTAGDSDKIPDPGDLKIMALGRAEDVETAAAAVKARRAELGLGPMFGLGQAASQRALYHLGLNQVSLRSIIGDFQGLMRRDHHLESTERAFGFLLLESCDEAASNAEPRSRSGFDPPSVAGYYVATGNLWYRNIDWDDVFTTWLRGTATSASFQDILSARTASIPNYRHAFGGGR